MKKTWYRRFINWIGVQIYTILYVVLLGILTRYVVCNWDKCISMQFFSQFDGNNILFLVWLALIILFFYDVEGKELKVHRKGLDVAQKKIQKADSEYKQAVITDKMNVLKSQSPKKSKSGDKKQ